MNWYKWFYTSPWITHCKPPLWGNKINMFIVSNELLFINKKLNEISSLCHLYNIFGLLEIKINVLLYFSNDIYIFIFCWKTIASLKIKYSWGVPLVHKGEEVNTGGRGSGRTKEGRVNCFSDLEVVVGLNFYSCTTVKHF